MCVCARSPQAGGAVEQRAWCPIGAGRDDASWLGVLVAVLEKAADDLVGGARPQQAHAGGLGAGNCPTTSCATSTARSWKSGSSTRWAACATPVIADAGPGRFPGQRVRWRRRRASAGGAAARRPARRRAVSSDRTRWPCPGGADRVPVRHRGGGPAGRAAPGLRPGPPAGCPAGGQGPRAASAFRTGRSAAGCAPTGTAGRLGWLMPAWSAAAGWSWTRGGSKRAGWWLPGRRARPRRRPVRCCG